MTIGGSVGSAPMIRTSVVGGPADPDPAAELRIGRLPPRVQTRLAVVSYENVEIGNEEFSEKLKALSNSPFEWTNEIPRLYKDWSVDQIRDRQRRMADLAAKVWPL
jgi:Protein of unknown function (DUF1524)